LNKNKARSGHLVVLNCIDFTNICVFALSLPKNLMFREITKHLAREEIEAQFADYC